MIECHEQAEQELRLQGAERTHDELDARLQTSESDAPQLLVAHTDMGAQALQGFRRSGRINVAYGAVHYGLKASPGERAGVEQFFSACSRT